MVVLKLLLSLRGSVHMKNYSVLLCLTVLKSKSFTNFPPETLAYAYSKQSGVSVRVARIFNTYGPRMHAKDGRVVSNFIIQALEGTPITVYGDGDQSRSVVTQSWALAVFIGFLKVESTYFFKTTTLSPISAPFLFKSLTPVKLTL